MWKPRPDFNVVTCRHLIVKDASGGPAVDIHAQNRGPHAGSGVITVFAGSPQVGTAKTAAVRLSVKGKQNGPVPQCGVVETFGPLGSPATQLVSDPGGGAFQLYDPNGKPKQLTLRLRQQPNDTAEAASTDDDPRQAPPSPPVVPEADHDEKDETEEAVETAASPSRNESATR